MEREAITAREAGTKLEEFWIGGLRKAAIDGDVEGGSLMAGQSVGLVREILPVRKVLDQLIEEGVEEAEKILRRLGR
jgi:enoyl-[acyl-carrier protein] reductase II